MSEPREAAAPEGERGLVVQPGLVIPESELEIQRTRSGGPGGQNVNKVNTRVELFFDVAGSAVLSRDQKARIRRLLATRISKQGVLRVVSQAERTQARNMARARERLVELLQEALKRQARRRATRPTRASRQKRVDTKKQRGAVKRQRRKPASDD